MTPDDPGSHHSTRPPDRRRLWRWRRVAYLTPLLVAVGLLAAACGGSPSPAANVASLGKSTTTDPSTAGSGNSGSGSSSSSRYQAALKYSECMRAHGVTNFPDPGADGSIEIQSNGPSGSNSLHPNSAQFNAADQACKHLLPNGGQPTAAQKAQMEAQALKYSQCMRAHGLSNFPDPDTSGGGIGFKLDPSMGIDPRSPQFQNAQKACSHDLPGRKTVGSPGSGSGNKTALAG
jgi:hypothetical protein